MIVKEYFNKYLKDGNSVTFIVAKAEKDNATPFYHPAYITTPICYVREWLKNDKMVDYIVLNDKQPPIDWLSGAKWSSQFNCGFLTCILIISREELHKLYGEEQVDSIEKFIENEIEKRVR